MNKFDCVCPLCAGHGLNKNEMDEVVSQKQRETPWHVAFHVHLNWQFLKCQTWFWVAHGIFMCCDPCPAKVGATMATARRATVWEPTAWNRKTMENHSYPYTVSIFAWPDINWPSIGKTPWLGNDLPWLKDGHGITSPFDQRRCRGAATFVATDKRCPWHRRLRGRWHIHGCDLTNSCKPQQDHLKPLYR